METVEIILKFICILNEKLIKRNKNVSLYAILCMYSRYRVKVVGSSEVVSHAEKNIAES